MAKFHLPNGAHVFLESTVGPALVASAVSNANPAVLTVADSGLVDGDVVRIGNSNWGDLANLVARVSVDDGAVTLIGVDTSLTDIFPAGSAAGTTLYKILTWEEIPNITTTAADGNEQQFYSFQFLADARQRNLPTYKSASTLTFTFAHDSTLSLYTRLRQIDRQKQTVGMYIAIPGVESRYWSATQSFNDQPTPTVNELEVVSVACALQSQAMTFAPVT